MKTNEEIVEELDSLANIYGWHHGNCAGHSHHPSCPVVKLRRMFITTLEAKDKECEERVKEERQKCIAIIEDMDAPEGAWKEALTGFKRVLVVALTPTKTDKQTEV